MSKIKFDQDSYYHIFNRVIGWEKLFLTEDDYYYFKKKLDKFIIPIANIYAYCLMPTHFHLVIKTKSYNEIIVEKSNNSINCFDTGFNNLFNSYVRSFNKAHHRHGKLFQQSFKHKIIDNDDQLLWTIYYVHRNPVHHDYVKSCDKWKHSSYSDILYNRKDLIDYSKIIEIFNGLDSLVTFTETMTNDYKIEKLINDYNHK